MHVGNAISDQTEPSHALEKERSFWETAANIKTKHAHAHVGRWKGGHLFKVADIGEGEVY